MKKRVTGALSLVGLFAAYLTLRYPLFFLHGMKAWPFVLFIAGVGVIAIGGLALGRAVLPLLTLIGYIAGFIAGCLFQFDYGPGLNSLWIIWMCVYLTAVAFGIGAELFCRKREPN